MGTAVRAQADHGACAGQQHIGGEVKESRGGGEAEMLTGVTMFSSERKSLRWPAAVQTAHCSSGRGYGGEAQRKKRRGAWAVLIDKNGGGSGPRWQWWLKNWRGAAAVRLPTSMGGRGEEEGHTPGGQGGPSRVWHVARWREGPGADSGMGVAGAGGGVAASRGAASVGLWAAGGVAAGPA
jgi:hypothetical protein